MPGFYWSCPYLAKPFVVCQGKDEFLKETKIRRNRKRTGVNGYFESENLEEVILCYSKCCLDEVICSAVKPGL